MQQAETISWLPVELASDLFSHSFSDLCSQVLNHILAKLDMDGFEPTASSDQLLTQWHGNWENGQFARNIPAMESSIGFKILWLAHP